MKEVLFFVRKSLIILLGLSLFWVSCSKDDPKGLQSVVDFKEQTVSALEQELEISFISANTWTLSSSKTWVDLDKKNGDAGEQVIKLHVAANTSVNDSRNAVLTLQIAGEGSYTLKITQTTSDRVMTFRNEELVIAYNKSSIEIKQLTKSVSNFEWKVKSKPDWVGSVEPVSDIITNNVDSTSFVVTLNKELLDVNELNGEIAFIDKAADVSSPTVATLKVKFTGMGLNSIDWERLAFESRDPQEDKSVGILFRDKVYGEPLTSDEARNKRVDVLYFDITTPESLKYSTVEEAKQYFDVFALNSTTFIGHPDNNIGADAVQISLEQSQKVRGMTAKRWVVKVKPNPGSLRRRFIFYVLPKGERELMFKDGVFDKLNYEDAGKMFTQMGGNYPMNLSVTDPDVTMGTYGPEVEVPDGQVGSFQLNLKTDNPDIWAQLVAYVNNSSSLPLESVDFAMPKIEVNENDPYTAVLTVKYNKNEPEVKRIRFKYTFEGDYKKEELLILTVNRK